jgi:DNA replication protein DnaC
VTLEELRRRITELRARVALNGAPASAPSVTQQAADTRDAGAPKLHSQEEAEERACAAREREDERCDE